MALGQRWVDNIPMNLDRNHLTHDREEEEP